jgi:hemerythrin-like domain-containing protein
MAKKRAATGRKRTAKRAGGATKRRMAVKGKAAKKKTAARSAASRSTRKSKKPLGSARGKAAAKPSRLAAAATLVRGAAAGAVAAVTERLPWAKNENDPIALLETDHRRFEDLLKLGEETTERAMTRRGQVLDALTSELNVHEAIEEKILYPALKPHAEARDIVLEGYQEHHVADVLVKELHACARDDERWGAKFKVLKESLEHHIDEEEGNMFRTARAVLSREELDGLGARMKKLKAELEA